MGLPILPTAAVVAALAAGLVATLTIWVPSLYESRAMARAALDSALTANASLISERNRAVRDADAERDRAIARQRERDGLAAQVATLRQSLGDSLGECKMTPAQLEAIDRFLRGEKP